MIYTSEIGEMIIKMTEGLSKWHLFSQKKYFFDTKIWLFDFHPVFLPHYSKKNLPDLKNLLECHMHVAALMRYRVVPIKRPFNRYFLLIGCQMVIYKNGVIRKLFSSKLILDNQHIIIDSIYGA